MLHSLVPWHWDLLLIAVVVPERVSLAFYVFQKPGGNAGLFVYRHGIWGFECLCFVGFRGF